MVRIANQCVTKVRQRVQNETLGHRGHKNDPLYRIRKVLLIGNERLTETGAERMRLALLAGDPDHEVTGAWLAKEAVRAVYQADTIADATMLLAAAITEFAVDEVPEINTLGRTLKSWRNPILAYFTTRASNGPVEGLNLLIKKVKRCGHGFTNFTNYRLRVLLHTGGIHWPNHPNPPRIRTRTPHPNA